MYVFSQKSSKASPLQEWQLQYISQFITDLWYVKGEENIPADVLSRIQADLTWTVPYDEITKAQQMDSELRDLLNKKETSIILEQRPIQESEYVLICDMSTGKP